MVHAVGQVVNGIMVPTFTEMFKQLAVILVDWEDHRVQVPYTSSLTYRELLCA